ncbi:SDR family oxidoreductase [Roseomonas terrae]|jgi:NAD(P)-dependent dehydrogenase (short-subunit alcohol dehydrogenase family)|uniref:SDR family oxidoreductase n=1 Tax=Neoroseomonas terrae TaxID=424799 RepID=A0ABS5EGF7_9PROT|nr:SDR family oxidoreductase [Neoroseomonas terrae]MBR0650103.1 SDR family oxidoreductase [Neoroseomonas terrae]
MTAASSLPAKVVLISGGGGGIGSAAARAFGAAGYGVAIADHRLDRAEAAAASVVAAGGMALAIETDVTDDASVAAAVAATLDRFGRLDALYNCAGGTDPADGPVTDVPLDAFDRTINLDLRGTFLCCRHAIPAIIRAGGGAVINMSSGAALRGASPYHCYSAAKGAILSLTRALAGHYAKQGVRVNCIASGRVMTERVIGIWGTLEESVGRDPQDPVGRQRDYPFWIGEPEHIAATAVFLASDGARMITGATVPADGGRSAY